MSKLIQAVWPLPGGNGRYLYTLIECLEWLASKPAATREEMIRWFGERYNAAKSAPGYLGVLDNLGVVSRDRGGRIELTSLGREVLAGDPRTRIDILARRFLTGYVGYREVLHLLAQSESPLSIGEVFEKLSTRFPTWTTPIQFAYRLEWLISLGLVVRGNGRTFEITELGKQYVDAFPPDEWTPEERHQVGPASAEAAEEGRVQVEPLEELIKELREAAVDSSNPERFEAVTARVFEELGFSVTQLGDSGDTDVLVTAAIGASSYSVVVDAKSRQGGRVDALEVLTLLDHRTANHADFAAVVAGNFGGGKVAAHAREHGVALLPIRLLEEWVRSHHRWPQSLANYRVLFTTGGLLEHLPDELHRLVKVETRWSTLVSEIIELMSEMYGFGMIAPMSPQHLHTLLVARLRGVLFPEKDVTRAMEFLSHPAVGALVEQDGGYALVMPRQSLGLRLRRLADQIEAYGAKEAEG